MGWWLFAACVDPRIPTGETGEAETGLETGVDSAAETGSVTGDTGSEPSCPDGADPQILSSSGCILGALTPSGREQFLGVPYAEPPVGDLRFAATVPVLPWTEPLLATALGPRCVSFGESLLEEFDPSEPGAEDCLTLNIFRPQAAEGLPLMFFVHGGGHVTGAGSESYLVDDPDLAEGAVVVTMNYRLGPLGYLAHPDLSAEDPDNVSGNFGLQDVIVALRWARDNALALGADPDRIVLFGESAGGLQTCAVLSSPAASGLADAAIIQSAPCSALSIPLRDPPPLRTSAEEQGVTFVSEVGCEGADVPACLRSLPIETIVDVGYGGVGPLSESEWAWEPNVDDVWMRDLVSALTTGSWNQVPVIATVNGDEGTVFTTGLAPDQAALDSWIDAYALLLGVDEVALAAMYDPALYGGSTEAAFAALFGDSAFVCPTVWQQAAIAGQVPARGGYWLQEQPLFSALGAFHGSEMPFVFGTLPFASDEEEALSLRMRSAWRTAADAEPNWSDLGPWPLVTEGWVEIDEAPGRVVSSPRAEQCALFESSRANPFD